MILPSSLAQLSLPDATVSLPAAVLGLVAALAAQSALGAPILPEVEILRGMHEIHTRRHQCLQTSAGPEATKITERPARPIRVSAWRSRNITV